MKNIFKYASFSLLVSAVLSAGAAEYTISEKTLDAGKVDVYSYGDLKLHVYDTQDPMTDVLYAVESDNGLVLLESTALKENVEVFNNYLKSLRKDLKGAILSYHPNGYSVYKSKVYATDGAVKSWNEGSVKALTEQFSNGFGKDKVALDLPQKADAVKIGDTLTLAGVNFYILDGMTPEGHFDVAIPKINAVYTHMMGADVHNILPSKESIAAEIQRFEKILHDDYELILTSHYLPETQSGVMQKIVYLKRVNELAQKCTNRKEFISAVKESFPSYKGEAYLNMTASMLFSK